jgi:tetratricopeptide (TPR) repeat protein
VDPNNPIVKLCAQGMEAESTEDLAKAKACFEQAWGQASDNWEKCVAAHYLARHQTTPEAILQWNEECLTHACAVGDESVAGFYPSLYLNIGHSHEVLGNKQQAVEGYRSAERLLDALPAGPYADMVKDGVARGLARMKCPVQGES